jgi:hypothetical protein
MYLFEENIHSLVAADPEDRSKEENIPQTQHHQENKEFKCFILQNSI